MAKSSRAIKRHALTILELCLAICIVSMVFAPLGSTCYKSLKKQLYQRDVSRLKSDLQLAYDFVLHCDVQVNVTLEPTTKGTFLSLLFENKELQKKWPSKKLYPHIKRTTFDNKNHSDLKMTFSEAGDYQKPIFLSLYGEQPNLKQSIELKGYPHVLEIEKN